MIDAHCHLNFHSFEKDIDQVVEDARKSGVTKIVNVGTSILSSKKAVELANKYPDMYAIVGIHPHHADKVDLEYEGELPKNWLEELEVLASNKKVIAIGEIGLDHHFYKSNGIVEKKLQRDVFQKQIDLAQKLNLPLQIHNRLAGEDIIKMLIANREKLRKVPGMFHCFAGTKDVLNNALELGFYIGFDGNITYKGLAPGESVELKELVLETPIDRILVETDSPFLTPIPLRGTRNVPKNVIITAQYISKLKGIDYKFLEKSIYENFSKVFEQKVAK